MLEKIFKNPKAARYVILGFIILVLFYFVREADAETTLELGVPAISMNFTTSNGPIFILSERINDKWNIGFGLVGEQIDKYDREVTNNIFVHGQRIVKGTGFLRYTYMGMGLAYFNNTSATMGSHVNFSLSIEYYKPQKGLWPDYLTIRHFSNAGSSPPNAGQDSILLGWSFDH